MGLEENSATTAIQLRHMVHPEVYRTLQLDAPMPCDIASADVKRVADPDLKNNVSILALLALAFLRRTLVCQQSQALRLVAPSQGTFTRTACKVRNSVAMPVQSPRS